MMWKFLVICLIGLCVVGSTAQNLRTWTRKKAEERGQVIVVLVIWLTIAAFVFLLCAAAWQG